MSKPYALPWAGHRGVVALRVERSGRSHAIKAAGGDFVRIELEGKMNGSLGSACMTKEQFVEATRIMLRVCREREWVSDLLAEELENDGA